MADELSKKDLEQLETDLKLLKETYQKELEREAAERDLQVTRDSKQAEISAKDQVTQEKKASDKEQDEKVYRETILQFLKDYTKKEADLKLKTVEQTEQELTKTEQFQFDVKVGFWLVIFVIIASNISNIFFDRMLRSWN